MKVSIPGIAFVVVCTLKKGASPCKRSWPTRALRSCYNEIGATSTTIHLALDPATLNVSMTSRQESLMTIAKEIKKRITAMFVFNNHEKEHHHAN